ncbi:anti-sigma factor [Sphingomonas rosea]|uniref:Anti-sigma factor n=1 Tax=Sphingomonas rosea TaxID=335605 RepID=A0ABP7U3H4_9SPHN
MTGEEHIDRDALAAELAMGLLVGDERREAERLLRTDPAFAAEVRGWGERLAPLLDEVEEVPAPAGLIDTIGLEGRAANDNAGGGRLRFWQGWSAASTAVAAALALFIAVRPTEQVIVQPPVVAAAAPMVAAMSADGSPLRLVATWDPAHRSLVVAAATAVGDPGPHSHELWVIPADGKPRSLGVMPGTGKMHGELTPEQARLLEEGASLALSVEPLGGSTTGLPTGPVVAAGKLETT